jgi:phosphatidylglycerophosphate synthase
MDQIREIVRRYARLVAGHLHRLSRGQISANTITYISLAGHFPVAVLIASGHWFWGALLLLFFALFDVLDGELARYQQKASPRGMLLDATTDRIKETALYCGVAYYVSLSPYAAWTWIVVAACGASLLVSYVKAKGESAIALSARHQGHHRLNRLFSFGIAGYEIRMLILLLGLISNQLLLAVAIIAVLSVYTAIERLITINQHV